MKSILFKRSLLKDHFKFTIIEFKTYERQGKMNFQKALSDPQKIEINE